jgi:hypothetical protein
MILTALKSARTIWLIPVKFFFLAALSAGCTAISPQEPAQYEPVIGETQITQAASAIIEENQVVSAFVQNTQALEVPAPPTSFIETPSPTDSIDNLDTPVPPLAATPVFTPAAVFPDPTQSPVHGLAIKIPDADIQVFRPGPASKVVSPFRVSTFLMPGYQGNVIIELFGEDGRMLARKVFAYRQHPGVRLQVNTDLEFEIQAVAESSRLVIRTEDQNNRTISKATIELLLLSLGDEENNPPGDLKEKIAILEPVKNLSIQGGSIHVSGLARPTNTGPLHVELFSEKGISISPAQLIWVSLEDDRQHVPFTLEIPYTISIPTRASLFITELDYDKEETLHITSVEIHLRP